MADVDFIGLPVLTTAAGEDLLAIIDDPSGTPITKKITRTNFLSGLISDTAFGASWNGVTDIAPSKNAIYDKIESMIEGPDTSTNLAIVLWDGTGGNCLKNSLTTMDGAGAPTLPNDIAIRWKDSAGITRNVIAYDSVDNIIIGVDEDDAKVYIERLDTSTAGNPMQSSRHFSIVANYWKASAAHQRMSTIWHEMFNDNPMSRLHLEVGEDGDEKKVMSLENDNGTLLAIFQGNVKIEGGSPGVGKVLTSDVNGFGTWELLTGAVGGDVLGPPSATDTAMCVFDGVSGKLIKNSTITFNAGLFKLNGNEILFNNNLYLLFKNAGGLNRIGMGLTAGDDWQIARDGDTVSIGYGCTGNANPVMIRVNSTNDLNIERSNDTDGAGKHYLVVT